MDINIIGHSHTRAVKNAISKNREISNGIRVFNMKENNNLSYINILPNSVVISMVSGNFHNVLGLVNHPKPFRFIIPNIRILICWKPTVNRRVIYFHTALGHHLLQFAIADPVFTIPLDTTQYQLPTKMTPYEI